MILSILYDVKFIIGLLIALALSAVVSFYFTQRIEEQNEKIGAMSVVVQALVKELREPRFPHSQVQEQPIVMRQDGGVAEQTQTIDLAALDEINDLIEVSDDGEDSYESESDSDDDGDNDDASYQTRSIQIGDAVVDEMNELVENLKDSSDSEEDSEEDSESDEDSEEDEHNEEFIKSLDVDVDVVAPVLLEEVDASGKDPSLLEPEQTIYKTIHISLDGADDVSFLEVPRATDYKKMSLSELRAAVLNKNLCADSSKMKKQQLYKLLGVEQ